MYKEKSILKSFQVFATFGLIPLLVFGIVVLIPFFSGLFLSLTNWNGSIDGKIEFIGIGNYISAVRDPAFWGSLGKTFYYVFFVMILTNTSAFLFGMLVTSGMKGQNFYRAGYFTPNLIGGVIPFFEISWLTEPHAALWVLIVVGVWQNGTALIFFYMGFGMPMTTFMYHGFMKGISKEMEEAALIDGCSHFYCFWKIVFPNLKPITTTILIVNILWIWNDFLLPSLVLIKDNNRTIPLSTFYFFGEYTAELGLAMAALILSVLPVVVIYLFLQKQIVTGVMDGAIK